MFCTVRVVTVVGTAGMGLGAIEVQMKVGLTLAISFSIFFFHLVPDY